MRPRIELLRRGEAEMPDPLEIPREERFEDGLLCVGGDLSPERLVNAYGFGIFPWPDYHEVNWDYVDKGTGEGKEFRMLDELIPWYSPMERFVIFPEEIHISRSMRKLLKRPEYHVTFDRCFDRVIESCGAGERSEEGNCWLGPRIQEAFKALHRLGYAHSVEAWKGDELIGGMYGVVVNGNFLGESMFSSAPNGSKFALIGLAEAMKGKGKLIDCQMETPHLKSMGGRYIPYAEFRSYLDSKIEGEI